MTAANFSPRDRIYSLHLSTDNHNVAVLQVHLKSSDGTQKQPPVTAIGKARSPTGLAISANGSWLVVTGGYKVYIAKTSDLAAGFTKYVSPDRITCLAFHPTEEYFATGDTKGVVRLWYCLNDSLAISVKGVEKRTHTRSLHWHAHAVSSLAFTRNGAYLLSGGEESVLVVWQLETSKKEFIPRIGAPISTITVRTSNLGEEEYLVGLADATYVFVSAATLKVTRTYSRVKTGASLRIVCWTLLKHLRSCAFMRVAFNIKNHLPAACCTSSILNVNSTLFPSIICPNLLALFLNACV